MTTKSWGHAHRLGYCDRAECAFNLRVVVRRLEDHERAARDRARLLP